MNVPGKRELLLVWLGRLVKKKKKKIMKGEEIQEIVNSNATCETWSMLPEVAS